MKKMFGVIAATLVATAAQASPLVVYQNDFGTTVPSATANVTVTDWTNGSIEIPSTGAWNAAGWAGNYFANRSSGNPATASVLTIADLPSHDSVSIAFLLGFLESWDSTNGVAPPDLLRITVDGSPILNALTANSTGSAENYGGGTELFDNAQINFNNFYDDTLVDMSTAAALSFAHSASTLTISIQAYGAGWQGGADEAWGIDSVTVTINTLDAPGVPEPASWAMMIAGFGLVGGAMRRRSTDRLAIA